MVERVRAVTLCLPVFRREAVMNLPMVPLAFLCGNVSYWQVPRVNTIIMGLTPTIAMF